MDVQQIDRLCDLYESRLKQQPGLEVVVFLDAEGLPHDADLVAELTSLHQTYESSVTSATTVDGGFAMLSSGESLGQYRLERVLGRGGMGTVFYAIHQALNRPVALKVLSENLMEDLNAVSRFQREMRIIGRLRHPNIVPAIDAGEANGRHYLAMEYIDGPDADSLAQAIGPMNVADACEIVRQAALGLQHAHDHEIIHRDVKPANLLIDRQGMVMVTDLGLAATAFGLGDSVQDLTEVGQILGTFDYMAPEQGADITQIDARVDVYALGATLFRLLTGTSPIERDRRDGPLKQVLAVMQKPRLKIESLRGDVPHELALMINSMLSLKLDSRPASCLEVAERLESLSEGHQLPSLVVNHADQHSIPEHPTPLNVGISPSSTQKMTAARRRPRHVTMLAVSGVIVTGFVLAVQYNWRANSNDPSKTSPGDSTIVDRSSNSQQAIEPEFESTDAIAQDSVEPLQVANYVTHLGGSVEIDIGDETRAFQPGERPDQPFQIDWITLPEEADHSSDGKLLELIARLDSLAGLSLPHAEIGDREFEQFAKSQVAPTVSYLDLRETDLTGQSMLALKRFVNLTDLKLSNTIKPAQLKPILTYFQQQLEVLYVKGFEFDSETWAFIGAMSQLDDLDIRETNLDDQSIQHLRGLKNLREVSITNTNVTDSGLSALYGLQSLKKLDLSKDRFSEDALQELQRQLPGCQLRLEN